MCEVLDLTGSGYYDWVNRTESEKEKEDKKLLKKIKRVHKESHETYGVRRVTAQLKKEGIYCGKTRAGRLMRENKIYCRTRKKYKATTNSKHNYPIAPNLLEQDFEAEKPDEKYVGDITYVWTDEGWLYLAGVEDLFNREIIGRKISDRKICGYYAFSNGHGNRKKSSEGRRQPPVPKGLLHIMWLRSGCFNHTGDACCQGHSENKQLV
jgi:putative transposase